MERTKALFLDLDGTIIITRSGRKFPVHSEDWKFIDSTLACIIHHYRKGYAIVIVTNQGGIEEGYTTKDVFVKKIEKICSEIEQRCGLPKNSIAYRYCPTMNSYYRKPSPGMAYDLAIDYELNLGESTMVGDMESDKVFAFNAGIRNYLDIIDVKQIEWNVQ